MAPHRCHTTRVIAGSSGCCFSGVFSDRGFSFQEIYKSSGTSDVRRHGSPLTLPLSYQSMRRNRSGVRRWLPSRRLKVTHIFDDKYRLNTRIHAINKISIEKYTFPVHYLHRDLWINTCRSRYDEDINGVSVLLRLKCLGLTRGNICIPLLPPPLLLPRCSVSGGI